jgi:uncharacterized surface protein with fasciclin (FAS1) repeats
VLHARSRSLRATPAAFVAPLQKRIACTKGRAETLTRLRAVGGLTRVATTGVFYRRPVVVGRKLLEAAAPVAAMQAAGPCKTVAEVLKQSPNLSALNGVAGRLSPPLKAELSSKAGGAFTFFAPSDTAIQSLLSSLPNGGKDLVSNETALTALLSYHLVPGAAVMAADLKDGQQLSTALKGVPPLRVRLANGGVLIIGVGSEASVTQADIKTCRGVVHVIDTVLLPLMGSGEEMAAQVQRG